MFDWRAEAEEMADRIGFGRLKHAVELLSEAYREGRGTESPRLDGEALVAAYLAVRFPATLAVAQRVARAVTCRLGDFRPESVLDLGAGCGAASLGMAQAWGGVEVVSAIERLPAMAALGKKVQPDAIWRTADFHSMEAFATHDVALFCYALGENQASLEGALAKAWEAANRMVIVIEPGTPRGFDTITRARDWMIAEGASIAVPCPGNAACPALGIDWCHFAARLNRTSLHRRLKGGTLGYEDEKYSYVAGWKGPLEKGPPRVLRHPSIQPGRIELEVCEAPARRKISVTKRDKEAFRIARKIEWGDEILSP